MSVRITREMNWNEYVEHSLGEKVELSDYTKSKSHKLPNPYSRKTNKREGAILAEVKSLLTRNKIFFKRIDVAGKIMGGALIPSQMVGMPDIIAIKEGVFYGIELKASGGTVSTAQLNTLQDIKAAGGRACILVEPMNLMSYFENGKATALLNGVDVV